MYSKVDGSSISVRFMHSPNAKSFISVIPSGMSMAVKLSHPTNAPSPISVTLSGITIFFK